MGYYARKIGRAACGVCRSVRGKKITSQTVFQPLPLQIFINLSQSFMNLQRFPAAPFSAGPNSVYFDAVQFSKY